MISIRTWHIVGDIHGHYAAFCDLLSRLGYFRPAPEDDPHLWEPPPGCKLLSVGDAVDRGLDGLSVLQTLRRMKQAGFAAMVLGNHEWRMRSLLRAQLDLEPRPLNIPPSRQGTWLQLLGLSVEEKRSWLGWIEDLPCWLSIDDGKALIVHARWEARFAKLTGQRLIECCAFGRTSAAADEDKTAELIKKPAGKQHFVDLSDHPGPLPAWAQWTRATSRGPLVVWGHKVVIPGAVVRLGNSINVESGCFQGHALSAYTYPSGVVVQAPNTRHWRAVLNPLLKAQASLFPDGIRAVRRIIDAHNLVSEEDYLAWVQLEADSRGVRIVPPALLESHRRVFRMAVPAL